VTPDAPWTPQPPVVAIADNTPIPVTATPTITPPPRPPRLDIPRLDIAHTIVTVPIQAGEWDVSSLGEQVGWLEGTGRVPATAGAPVLVGHMTYPDANLLEQGAFAYLQEIRLGDEVVYEVEGERYVYEVVAVGRIAPADVSALFAADGETLFLLTCTDWNNESRVYENRLLVRAVRR
ncbi:MAG: class F sortase, partial [Anaerolineales bacterium]|nr:class F sortase [Anaerolineales bacterium]